MKRWKITILIVVLLVVSAGITNEILRFNTSNTVAKENETLAIEPVEDLNSQVETNSEEVEETASTYGFDIETQQTIAMPTKPITPPFSSTKPNTAEATDVLETRIEEEIKTLKHQTIYQNDADLEAGKTEISQKGKDGSQKVTFEVSYRNDKEVSRKSVSTKIIKEPVEQIVIVGTKGKKSQVVVTEKIETEIINYKTVNQNDSNLEKGKKVVKQEGKNGLRTIVTEVKILDNKVIDKKIISSTITEPAIDRIVLIGTKIETTVTRETITEPIAFKKVVQNDSNLEKGKTITKQVGENGIKSVVYEITKKENQIISRKIISTTITKQPVDEIQVVGTKVIEKPVIKTERETITESVPFKTVEQKDSTLEQGKTVVKQEGQTGVKTTIIEKEYSDGKLMKTTVISSEITKEAIDKIVLVGTKTVTPPSTSFRAEVARLINLERTNRGLKPLKTNLSALNQAANVRAKEVIQVEKIGHIRPDGTRYYTVLNEFNLAPYSRSGENVGRTISGWSAQTLVSKWMASTPHRNNILSVNYEYVGIGYHNQNGYRGYVSLFYTP